MIISVKAQSEGALHEIHPETTLLNQIQEPTNCGYGEFYEDMTSFREKKATNRLFSAILWRRTFPKYALTESSHFVLPSYFSFLTASENKFGWYSTYVCKIKRIHI